MKFDFDKDFVGGCVPDPEDDRDLVFGDYLVAQKLPLVIDWRDLAVPVKEQKGPSCVGFSSAGMKEIQEKLEHHKVFSFDGLDLYNRCKKIDGNSSGGTSIRIAMKILAEQGIGEEPYKIKSYTKLNSLDEMKAALVATGPFIAGVDVYENFKDLKGGVIPDPSGSRRGGHAICITGYNDNLKLFHFKNSWGSDWGAGGYGWLTYDFMGKYCHTAWAATDMEDDVTQSYIDVDRLAKDLGKIK